MNNLEKIKRLYEILDEVETFKRTIGKLNFDVECVCPKNGMEQANQDISFLSNYPFRLLHSEEYINLVKELHENHDSLNEYELKCVENLYKDYLKTKNVSEELNYQINLESGETYMAWLEAKKDSNYEVFKPHFKKMVDFSKTLAGLTEFKKDTVYDTILNDYEPGMNEKRLDDFFNRLKKELLPLIEEIKHSKVVIKDDFMHRPVNVHLQEEFSKWILKHEGHNMDSLVLMTTEHPFTTGFGKGDERVTTHYYENDFVSNIFTTLHEGGHALFDQNEKEEFYKYHIEQRMTMAMHECMSRFFENMVGRSKAFIHLLYPVLKEKFKDNFKDVSEEDLYKAINIAKPSLIRCDADELTYPFHIIIRYEMEKEFVNEETDFDTLNKKWNELYKKYLGIKPSNDTEGILQDVHWAYTYGYFPSYALGSAYAAQIYHRMNQDFDVSKAIEEDKIILLVNWLKDHAWNIASIKDPDDWIKEVTGEEFNPDYYINYLKDKFKEIYQL